MRPSPEKSSLYIWGMKMPLFLITLLFTTQSLWAQIDLWGDYDKGIAPKKTSSSSSTPSSSSSEMLPQISSSSQLQVLSSSSSTPEAFSSSSSIPPKSLSSSSALTAPSQEDSLSSSFSNSSSRDFAGASSSETTSSSSGISSSKSIPKTIQKEIPRSAIAVPGKASKTQERPSVSTSRGTPPPDPKPESKFTQEQSFQLEDSPTKAQPEINLEQLNRSLLDLSASEVQSKTPVTLVPKFNNKSDDYKSPKTAAFLSLLLPGAGQYYIGGTGNVVRGLVYSLAEIGLGYSIYQYTFVEVDEQMKAYQDLAQSDFSNRSYEDWATEMRIEASAQGTLEDLNASQFYDRENWCRALLGNSNSQVNQCLDFSTNHAKLVGSSSFSPDSKDKYYNFLESDRFQEGWSSPEQRQKFLDQREKAQELSDLQPTLFTFLVLNHIVSALDAAWAASSHNDGLYQKNLKLQSNLYLHPKHWKSGVKLSVNF